jgi:hypothetical protein
VPFLAGLVPTWNNRLNRDFILDGRTFITPEQTDSKTRANLE